MGDPRTTWAERLRAIGAPVVDGAPAPDPMTFRDEMGHRRAADGAFLAWRCRVGWGGGDGGSPDAALWAGVANGGADLGEVVDRIARGPRGEADRGALLPQSGSPSIEVWTESELCALHALSWLSQRDASLVERLHDCARWHLENLQPDNATNRPWAAHVFIGLAIEEGRDDAMLHAQTLIHNCQVALGRPDTISAHILLDAAESLLG